MSNIELKEKSIIISVRKIIQVLSDENIAFAITGSLNRTISHLRSLDEADGDCLCFYSGCDRLKLISLRNCIVICRFGESKVDESVTLIKTDDPKLAFYIVAQCFQQEMPAAGIHPSAEIHSEARIHNTSSIGANCVIGNCIIGEDTIIHANTVLFDKTRIGSDVVIEPNSVIGATGDRKSVV